MSRSSKRTSRGPCKTAPRMIYLLNYYFSGSLVSSSMCGVTSVHRERVPDYKARTRARKPQNSRGDLFRPAESTDRLFLRDVLHGLGFFCDHVGNHRRFDCPGAHSIDANPAGGIFKSRALRQSDHAMFGCVIDSSSGDANETADRRIVHNNATSLFTHLEQLVLHAEPDTAEIDRIHSVELL